MKEKTQIGVMGDRAHIEGGINFGDRIYQLSPSAPVDAETLHQAEEKLALMPLDIVPDPAAVPEKSRLSSAHHNPLFVGRQQDLMDLAIMLKGGQTAAIGPIAAATGLGGIGKTQLASEFVHRYGQFFEGGVYWLNFADPQAIPAEVAACSHAGQEGLELEIQIKLVLTAWQSALPRLLVFDNCEDENLLAQWRPRSGASRVLVTSRRQTWAPGLGVDTLALGLLDRQESIELLCKLADHLTQNDAGSIARALGDLPLALHMAGSYLNCYQHEVQPLDYLQQLQDKALLTHESLKGRGTTFSPTEHELHVGKTFALSYERLNVEDSVDRIAITLLAHAACLAPGIPIQKALWFKTLDAQYADIDELLRKDGLNRLLALGLIEAESNQLVVLHRLLAAYVKNVSADENAQKNVETTLISEARGINNSGFPAGLLVWQQHLRFVTNQAKKRKDKRAAELCSSLGFHLDSMGELTAARPYYEQALEIRKKVLGEEHPDTAMSLNNMGYLLRAMGELTAARPYYEQALEIRKKVLGEEHPDTAMSLNNMGYLLQAMGELTAARPYYEQALEIRKKVLGEEHPDTAMSLNNMGGLLDSMGELTAARPYYEQALEINKKVLGEEHPDTATSLNNMGGLLRAMGELTAARPYYEQALEINKKVLGEEHPDTAMSLNNMAVLFYSENKFKEAAKLMRQALQIFKKALGEEHPNTRSSKDNLAAIEKHL